MSTIPNNVCDVNPPSTGNLPSTGSPSSTGNPPDCAPCDGDLINAVVSADVALNANVGLDFGDCGLFSVDAALDIDVGVGLDLCVG